MAKAATQKDTGLLQLDPAMVLANDNTRFSLIPARIASLADSIIAQGGVMVPVEVEPVKDATNGFKYRLTTGFYRHAAVMKLNAEQAAGLLLPAIAHTTSNPTERLKRQLVENMERENQSPMDEAVAIKKLLDMGIPKMEVRQMFSRLGRAKGNKATPVSNSFINIRLSFLDVLPKIARERLHTGILSVSGAYQLTKVPSDKMDAVMEKLEADRQRQIEHEEKEEERILAAEKKQAESATKKEALASTLATAEAKYTETQAALESATAIATEAFKASKAKYDTVPERKAAATSLKTAEQARKVADADNSAAQIIYEKALKAHTQHEASIVERAAKLRVARESRPANAAMVVDRDVQNAAVATGATIGIVLLSAKEMRECVTDLALPGGNEKVRAIGLAFQMYFSGEGTDKDLYRALVKIVT